MNAFNKAMNSLDEKYLFLESTKQIVSSANEDDKVIVFERGDLVFVFNFHTNSTYDGYKVGCDLPGKYRVALDSDALKFGGHGRVYYRVEEDIVEINKGEASSDSEIIVASVVEGNGTGLKEDVFPPKVEDVEDEIWDD